jgi:hypothetical protein
MRRARRRNPARFDLPEFMQSFRAAREWVRKDGAEPDLGDVPEDVRKEWIDDLVAKYVERAREIADTGEADIFREIRIPQSDDPRLVIDWQCLGSAWSGRPTSAQVQGGVSWRVPTEVVMLEGLVLAKHIDWERGLRLFVEFGEDEWELRLKDRSPVLVGAILRRDGGRTIYEPPIRGNSGTTGGNWESSGCADRWISRITRRLARRRKAGAR